MLRNGYAIQEHENFQIYFFLNVMLLLCHWALHTVWPGEDCKNLCCARKLCSVKSSSFNNVKIRLPITFGFEGESELTAVLVNPECTNKSYFKHTNVLFALCVFNTTLFTFSFFLYSLTHDTMFWFYSHCFIQFSSQMYLLVLFTFSIFHFPIHM